MPSPDYLNNNNVYPDLETESGFAKHKVFSTQAYVERQKQNLEKSTPKIMSNGETRSNHNSQDMVEVVNAAAEVKSDQFTDNKSTKSRKSRGEVVRSYESKPRDSLVFSNNSQLQKYFDMQVKLGKNTSPKHTVYLPIQSK